MKKFSINLFTVSLIILIILLNSTHQSHFQFLEDKETNTNDPLTFTASMMKEDNELDIDIYIYKENILHEDAVATIVYKKELEVDGWDKVTVKSFMKENNSTHKDEHKAYYMGYLEGRLTAERIWNHYINVKAFVFANNTGEVPASVLEFIDLNNKWMDDQINLHKTNDDYWFQVYMYVQQLKGMFAGYKDGINDDKKSLTYNDFVVMASLRDAGDLADNYKNNKKINYDEMSSEEIKFHFALKNHCSSLIKVLPDFSDVFFGHATWMTYSFTTRMFKEHTLITNQRKEHSKTVAFSSHPGALNSLDDFYYTSGDLFVTETTNPVFNQDLAKKINYNTLLTAVRVTVTNRLASSGSEWAKIFAKYNSGTYNNQFQILDLNKIDLENKKIEDNALWIVEQIPQLVESADLTQVLKYGYWPSYNSAYFKTIRDLSGYEEMMKKKPELADDYSYSNSARANIFRRDQGQIKDIDSFVSIMRTNDYKNDNLSKGKPFNAISSRYDLSESENAPCFGALDLKASSAKLVKGSLNKKFKIVNGPTDMGQPAFDWTTAKCAKDSRFVFNGLPTKYNFKVIEKTAEFY